LTRAINFQLGYNAHSKPNESKYIFGKRVLHHADFASIPNYDAVVIRPKVVQNNVQSTETKLTELQARLGVLEERQEKPEKAGTKRKRVPSNFIYLETMSGDEVQLPKFKRRMNISDEDLHERCEEGTNLLVAAKVPVTNVNLRFLGIGARSVNAFVSQRANEAE
jgi:hypothetical protein